MLHMQGDEVDFTFVEHCPRIRDFATLNKWLSHMVNALLVVRNPSGTARRLPSVLLKGEEWYAKIMLHEVISLPSLICLTLVQIVSFRKYITRVYNLRSGSLALTLTNTTIATLTNTTGILAAYCNCKGREYVFPVCGT